MPGRRAPGDRGRLLGLALAALLLALAAFLAVLAADVLRWRGHLERSDVAFASGGATVTDDPDMRLPARHVHQLLAVEDDLAFREALVHFRQSNPRRPQQELLDASLRSVAETELARVGRTDPSAARRSLVATLRGALAFEEARSGGSQSELQLRRSLDEFRQAIRLDESNEEAKYNLELVLGLLRETRSGSDGESSARRGDPVASGAGAASAGSGY